MKATITHQLLSSNPTVQAKAVAKVFNEIEFDPEDFSHAEIQFLLDNDQPFIGARLYSPVLTMNQLTSTEVPAGWPGGEKFDEDGGSLGQKNFEEYAQYFEVTGGYCIRFASGPKDANNNIQRPSFSDVKVWENKVNGFLTKAEFDDIRVIATP